MHRNNERATNCTLSLWKQVLCPLKTGAFAGRVWRLRHPWLGEEVWRDPKGGGANAPKFTDAQKASVIKQGEAIQLRHDQRFAGAHRSQSLGKAGANAGAAGQAVVGVDAVLRPTKLDQHATLNGEILLVGRTAGISDESVDHL